ncbi:hypothetical protein L596_011544 [Steinernema carpocapsae]|uniref:Uncharacterized protein n=1 Tax=Steinernema carpocapsae TaxID=34508 RepID=A0A4U5NU93_STECR|nr:hypothetical protein L596_011544 [Steinernema carpocapsae]
MLHVQSIAIRLFPKPPFSMNKKRKCFFSSSASPFPLRCSLAAFFGRNPRLLKLRPSQQRLALLPTLIDFVLSSSKSQFKHFDALAATVTEWQPAPAHLCQDRFGSALVQAAANWPQKAPNVQA